MNSEDDSRQINKLPSVDKTRTTARIVDQNPTNRARHRSARSQETALGVDQTAPTPSAEHDAPIAADCLDSELPDIIDLVLEMGRMPEEPPAEAQTPYPPLPVVSSPRLPAHLDTLADRARDYVEAASSANTRRAYASDWKQFASWCRRQGVEMFPPDPQVVGLYITACASGKATGDKQPKSVSTIERHLSALTWNYAQRGQPLDRTDRHIATVMAGIRNTHAAPPRQKEAVLPEDLIAMLETLDRGTLRGLRDRAMLLLGFAGALRRSEVVGLDVGRDQTEDGRGWVEILDKGMLLRLRGKTGWREVEVGRGSSDATCPVVALETWLKLARIAHGPLFRRVTGQGKAVGADRLNDQEVARLVKRTALAAGVRGDLPEGQRGMMFAGHSLRAGLASSAEVDERYVQKQLGHASAEMTRKYQRRRDRFRVNLTKAAGL
jgi:integrase